jgi:hypothetical protein
MPPEVPFEKCESVGQRDERYQTRARETSHRRRPRSCVSPPGRGGWMRHMQVLCRFCCSYMNTGDDDAATRRNARAAAGWVLGDTVAATEPVKITTQLPTEARRTRSPVKNKIRHSFPRSYAELCCFRKLQRSCARIVFSSVERSPSDDRPKSHDSPVCAAMPV